MKVYHVETQQAYDELMSELEEKGYEWLSGYKPTEYNYWEENKEDSYINISSKYIGFMNIEQSKKQHPNIPIIEYKAKGEERTTYLVETQEDYNALMIELENKGCMWYEEKPTAKNYWPKNEEKTYVMEENGYLTYGRMEQSYRELYSKEPFIDYKAKGENMTEEEMKHKLHELEPALQDTKSSAKNLIEKIDATLKISKPEFKVGDYVTVYVDGIKMIAKIDELTVNNPKAHGLWYDRTLVNVKRDYWFVSEGSKARHATPSEIEEYEAALVFHKHGRKPFEVKKGDLVRTPREKFTFIWNAEYYTKEDFLDSKWGFLKTVEEVNEWLNK